MSSELKQIDSIERRVCDYLERHSSISSSTLNNINESISEQQIDSLQLIQMVIWIEEITEKPVEIDALFSNENLTISSIADYIRSRQEN